MTVDLDALEALIAEARRATWPHEAITSDRYVIKLLDDLADALESTLAELRQERERAEEAEKKLEMPCGSCHPCTEWANQTWVNAGLRLPHVIDWQEMTAALSRAEETIEKVRACIGDVTEQWKPLVIADAITEYDKQKEADRG